MIQPELLEPKGSMSDALPSILEAEHVSALSIFAFMSSFDERLANVKGDIDPEAEQLYAGIQHCVTVGSTAERYLRVGHSLSARFLPLAEEGSDFAVTAQTTADALHRIHPQPEDEDLQLNQQFSGVRTLLLPKLIRMAKDSGVPPTLASGESKMTARIYEIKELASYMGNLVIAPAITASRELFLAALESGIQDIQSPEMLEYYKINFAAATITDSLASAR